MFITTANSVDTIPRPLLDRMELIEVSGYTEDEKLNIAKRHLLPRQIEEHGLAPKSVRIGDKVMRSLIRGYTLEAGVRRLQRTIGKVVRKSAVEMIDENIDTVTVTPEKLEKFLGAPRFHYEKAGKKPEVGVVNGLAYTVVGGDTLQIETTIMPGTGVLELTGSLGDVMKESARAARSYVRAHAVEFGIDPEFYKKLDIHIHVPEGAVPKDGPSAGVTMTTALVSALTGIPVKQNVAMTGEITLRGRVLPHWRVEGKAAGGASRGHRHRAHPEGKPQGFGRSARQRARSADHYSRGGCAYRAGNGALRKAHPQAAGIRKGAYDDR